MGNEVREIFRERKQAFEKVFDENDPAVRVVLAYLSQFCREHRTCFHPDARLHAHLEGRREVMLKIRRYLNLSVDELCANLEETNDGE